MAAPRFITKSKLARMYGISDSTLRQLLNVKYYETLKEIGYEKLSRIVPPVVVKKFYELYGEPLTDE